MDRTEIFKEIAALKKAYLLRRPLLLCLIFMAGGLAVLKSAGVLDRPGRNDPSHWAGERMAVTGVVTEPPEPNPRGWMLVVELETLRQTTTTYSATGKIQVQIFGTAAKLIFPGDRILFYGILQRPTPARIPGTFDYADYLANKNIYTQIFTGDASLENLGWSGSHSLLREAFKIKTHVASVFQRSLGAEEAAVLSGLVVGSRPRFNPEIKRIFTESGTMHILVASGSNVAFVVGLWFLLMRIIFRLPRRYALASSFPAIWGYVLVAGADPPIVRAGVMTSVGMAAYLLAREDRTFHTLGVAALSLILLSPKNVFDVGFQMSFLTVFGLIFYLPRLAQLMEGQPSILRWMVRLSAPTCVAQIWLWPVTLGVFKRFFPISVLSNMVIIPMAAGGLTAGLWLVLVDFVNAHVFPVPALLSGTSGLIRVYLRLMIDLTRFFADHPSVGYWVSCPGKIWVAGYYLIALCIVGIKRSWLPRFGCLLGIIFMGIGWRLQSQQRKLPADLQITWLDMGRTLSVLIETPHGEKILIDPGPRAPTDSLERSLMPYLTERGIKSLDALVVTGSIQPTSNEIESMNRWIKIKNVAFSTASFSVGKLQFEPLPGSRSGSARIPLLLRYGKTRILLGKTIGLKVQDFLLQKKMARLDLFQARFSEKAKWRNEFISRFKPGVLIETGFDSEQNPSSQPWKDIPVVVPQKLGFFRWRSDGLKSGEGSGGRN